MGMRARRGRWQGGLALGAAALAAMALAVPAGCGGGKVTAMRKDLAVLGSKLAALERARGDDAARMAELATTLTLLTDQVETLAVMARSGGRTPDLPVLKLAPPPAAGDPAGASGAAAPAPAPEPGPTPIVLGALDDAAGDAAGMPFPAGTDDGGGVRPLLTDRPPPAHAAAPKKAAAGASPKAAGDGPAKAAAGAPTAEALYARAMELLKAKDYDRALVEFNEIVKRFPAHPHADNALYWMGEIRYDRAEYMLAVSEFARVVREYPAGNKAPAALLKMGYSYHRLGDDVTARSLLAQVVDLYPGSDEARLASGKLEEWK
jgi:tol-pal system protein YbgF